MKKVEQSLGYTVAYYNKKGEVGYVGIDVASGGYPYFTDRVDFSRVRKSVAVAQKDVSDVVGMRDYYGGRDIVLDTVQLVEIIVKTADADYVKGMVEKELLERATKTFNAVELNTLKQLLKDKS